LNDDEHDLYFFNRWDKSRYILREPLAEWLGTLVANLIGLSASVVRLTAQNRYGNFLTADLAWGLGVMIGIYTSGGISGRHLNPAINIILNILRGFPWNYYYKYISTQFLATITAAAIVYGLHGTTFSISKAIQSVTAPELLPIHSHKNGHQTHLPSSPSLSPQRP
jgi:aquaglyceroporin related protein